MYCMEYMIQNAEWLEDELGIFLKSLAFLNRGEFQDDYLIFDLPGQIELYSHLGVVPRLCSMLKRFGYNICAVYLLDSHFLSDSGKFLAGCGLVP